MQVLAVHQMERLKSSSKDGLLLTLDRDGRRKERARMQTNSSKGMFQMLTFTRARIYQASKNYSQEHC